MPFPSLSYLQRKRSTHGRPWPWDTLKVAFQFLYGLAYYAVVLLEESQVAVHHHDFLYGYPELARPLFRRIHQDFGLNG